MLRWFKYGINGKEDGREETFLYDNVDKNLQVLSCKKFSKEMQKTMDIKVQY